MRMMLATCLAMLLSMGASAWAQEAGPAPANRLAPGDAVRIRVWREPDLSGDFVVDDSGRVVLPRLGQRTVTAASPETLRQQLVAEYSRFLQNPAIEVTLLRKVTVLGAVNKPGVYSVEHTASLFDVIAMAGGVSSIGVSDRLVLTRRGQRSELRLNKVADASALQPQSGDQLFIPERSWLERNAILVSVGASTVLTLVSILTR